MSTSPTSKTLGKTLLDIVEDTQKEIAADRKRESLEDLKRRIADAPAVVSLQRALHQPGVGLIAEIKQCSPSKGTMNSRNVRSAAELYKNSTCVRAISVLTNRSNFGKGMTLPHLLEVKLKTRKPVLRKEFILDDYQVYQARAYGADAILLMANLLKKQQLKRLFSLATDLGMDVLFETHSEGELHKIPEGARIYGINSRDFCSEKFRWSRAFRWFRRLGFGKRDASIDLKRFEYCHRLPPDAVKVAESGVSPEKCKQVLEVGFDAILVGTALLLGPEKIQDVLSRFEEVIGAYSSQLQAGGSHSNPDLAPAPL